MRSCGRKVEKGQRKKRTIMCVYILVLRQAFIGGRLVCTTRIAALQQCKNFTAVSPF